MLDRDPSPATQLLGALAVLLATGVALVAATLLEPGGPAAPPTGAAREAAPGGGDDALAIAETSLELLPRVARRVEEMRGLRFDEVPLPRVVTPDFLSDLIEREFRRREGEPAEALAADEAIARMVGLLDPDEDLLGLVEGSGDLAAAAWDTERERLYVVAGPGARSPALIELVLAHELTHALEDQRFGLPVGRGGSGDRALAETALVEGTATALMLEYARRHGDPLALALAALGLDPGTGELPAFALEQLEWAYLGGAEFVERLHELAGGWALVDHALEHRPPVSTSQVLHPIRYLRDERPVRVRIDRAPLRRAGLELDDGGTIGELATRQLLAVGTSQRAARQGAAGWAGDRYELWRRDTSPRDCSHPCREELALVMRWRWGSDADAARFARAARRYVEAGLGGEAAGRGAWALEGGWVALAAAPRTTTLAFAPGERLARRVAGAQSSPSSVP